MNVETKSKRFHSESVILYGGEDEAAWAQASAPPALVPGAEGSRGSSKNCSATFLLGQFPKWSNSL